MVSGAVAGTAPRALARDRGVHRGEVAGRPESPVDADREAAPLEEGQAGEHARDRPAGDGDELVDRPQPEHQLAPEPARRLPDIGQRRRRPCRDARLRQVVGEAEVVDQLRDPRHDPGGVAELAEEGQAAGRGGRVDRSRDQVALAALLERPRRRDERAAASRCLDHDRGIGQPADDPVATRERALARHDVRTELRHDRPARGDDLVSEPVVGARMDASRGRTR